MNKALLTVTVLAAALAGCATTESTDGSSPAATSSASTPPGSSDSRMGSAERGRVDPRTGAAVPPVAGRGGASGPELKRSVYFEFDHYEVKPEYRGLVEANARWLKANPRAKLVVEGNTDERGSREYNVGLGQRRSDGVKRMLVLLGARENQIESVSLGEEKPQDEGHNEDAWAKNRRSDILYSGEY